MQNAPTVIASKQTHGFAHFLEELDVVEGRINLMPGEFGVFNAWRSHRRTSPQSGRPSRARLNPRWP